MELNNLFTAPKEVIDFLTGLLVVITTLSMRQFKYTLSARLKWSKPLYYSGCVIQLAAILINRFVNYPPTYPPSSVLYVLSYLAFCGYVLYAASERAKRGVKWVQEPQSKAV